MAQKWAALQGQHELVIGRHTPRGASGTDQDLRRETGGINSYNKGSNRRLAGRNWPRISISACKS
ncbi:hypothetical protein OAO37_04770, partial [Planktomarina temperata]|nr:hypothetical protein [Planktomarina temperata]